jgi:hydroxyethylthiazole kinase-like uncharacterized protein yjeF
LDIVADRVELTWSELERRPLPDHTNASDKHDRGTVLIVGGSAETPGSLLLAGLAALRAGAGRVQLAVSASCARTLAVAVPEARVIGLPETAHGDIDSEAASAIESDVRAADAVLIGTGTLHRAAAATLVDNLLPMIETGTVVLDAGGIAAFSANPRLVADLGRRAVLIPNRDEADMLPGAQALSAADATGAIVAIRGAVTEIAEPGGPVFVDRSGNIGLASSGSGDVLAGVLTGLCARGTDTLTATLWAVAAHGRAGERCAQRIAPLGYLARDLLDELPAILATTGAAAVP